VPYNTADGALFRVGDGQSTPRTTRLFAARACARPMLAMRTSSRSARGTGSPRRHPLAWGDPSHVEKLLGKAFDLKFESGVNDVYYGSAGTPPRAALDRCASAPRPFPPIGRGSTSARLLTFFANMRSRRDCM